MTQAELFNLARSIDTHKESMAQSREQAIGGVTTGLIALNDEVTWRAWHFGIPFRMTSKITEMKMYDYFVDEQTKGPFKRFRHIHEFYGSKDGSTMVDRIEFEAPFGPLGRFIEKAILGSYLRELIEKRNIYLSRGIS